MNYTRTLFLSSMLLAIASLVVGCSESSPPPGAPQSTAEPTVEMGEENKAAAERENESVPTVLTADTGGSWATLTGRIVYDGKPPRRRTSSPPRTPKSAVSTRFLTSAWW